MEVKRCNEPNCDLEVKYVCLCSSAETYLCKEHFKKHKKLPNRVHTFEYVFLKPHEGTKEAILRYIEKEKCKAEKVKHKFIASFSQNLCTSENSFEDFLKKLESRIEEINNMLWKISKANKISKLEQDSVLKLLTLQPEEAIDKVKALVSVNSDSYNDAKLFCGLGKEIEKIVECYIKDKFEAALNTRLFKIETMLEDHDRAINLTNKQLSKATESISDLIKDVEKQKREFEDWKQKINFERENELSLLNAQLYSITQDLNNKSLGQNEMMKNRGKSEYKLPYTDDLNTKAFAILNRANDQEIERDFRNTCLLYENELKEICSSDISLSQAYWDYMRAYHLNTSLYLVDRGNNANNLFIYDTESEREEVKVLEIQETLNRGTCMAQLPNGELFCYGQHPQSGLSLIIDRNYMVRMLPSGIPCEFSSAVYFNKNVYCFGGRRNNVLLPLSAKFDFEGNQWIKLNPIPQPDCFCHSIIFNESILISGADNRNLLRYSISSDSFVRIPFEFGEWKRKILFNVGRLYLIEFYGYIYESGIGDETSWKQIGAWWITDNWPNQVYCSYNKGAIYIGISLKSRYYKFDLNHKTMIKL